MLNADATYESIIAHMLEHQHNIVHALNELRDAGQLPDGMEPVMLAAEKWADKVRGDASLKDAPSLEAVENFAEALLKNRGSFDEHMRREADEYNAFVGDLKKVFADK